MTNKIYLSFNCLYRLQDGEYHGAKLSFKIKHGDKVVAESEHIGKTHSKFISPITIEETEITQPLTVEYVCTGNVEDVSVYPEILPTVGKLCIKGGQIFCGNHFISDSILTNAIANNLNSDKREMKALDEFSEQVRSVIRRELEAGGLLWQTR